MDNVTAHLVSVQSFELIMAVAQHYMQDKRIVRAITREMVLEIRPDAIERAFHLPASDSFISISYKGVNWWYRVH